LVTVTIRRIPLTWINAGVWMIHTGIIILCLGSVYYFSTKVEGDAPVLRRLVVIETPDGQQVTFAAKPGNQSSIVTPDGLYSFQITSIDPQWELLSGDDQGKRAYSVNLFVTTPERQYIRQLIAGYPEYTEDLIRTNDPNQPFKRAVKETGSRLVDETLQVSLEYFPVDHFYLMQTRAIYLREVGSEKWIMRPVDGLPRFNDYLTSYDGVRITASDKDANKNPTFPLDPISVRVSSVDPNDPLAGIDLHITDYLRYAIEETKREPGGDRIDPIVTVRFESGDGQRFEYDLAAFDPQSNSAQQGTLHFVWADTESAKAALQEQREPVLKIRIPRSNVELDTLIRETTSSNPMLDFIPIEGTDYAYRVTAIQDGLAVRPGRSDNVMIVEIRNPERTFTRWVFDDSSLTRDLSDAAIMPDHKDSALIDPGIEMEYVPGKQSPPMTIIAGPGDQDLGVLLALEPGQTRYESITNGGSIDLVDDIKLKVVAYSARSTLKSQPTIVPVIQRDRNIGPNASMIRLQIPDGQGTQAEWLQFHQYAFDSEDEILRRFLFKPRVIELSKGRQVEILFSRQRMPLPTRIALDDFVVDSHIGGFTGSMSSILDWTSMITFEEDGAWTKPVDVHMNSPKEHRGYWFFQAQWDPPEPPQFQGDVGSAGLNYTVLGVGNRNGVIIQLTGCCIAVFGMIWAFYVKPILKRRKQRAVYVQVSEEAAEAIEADVEEVQAEVVAVMEEST
ncbi:MAG: hypothetical protein O7G85_09955, partial [Planctomycetota bacterium]|nr:hypothetical protein [Planctomycetota bacterium]